MSSGNRKVHRLSLRGNRRINHAIHMAAITQIRHKHSDGRACYDKKIAEGKTHKEALRSLKRRISDAVYARPQADVRQAAVTRGNGPGGQPGNDSDSSAAGSHPEHLLFGQATPGPDIKIRPPLPRQTHLHRSRLQRKPAQPLDSNNNEDSFCAPARYARDAASAAPDGVICVSRPRAQATDRARAGHRGVALGRPR